MTRSLTMLLFIASAASAQEGPAAASNLLRLPLSPGAVRVTDPAATREFGQVLNVLAKGQNTGCQASEYLVWDDADLATQISNHLAAQLRARDMTFQTLSEEEDAESYSLSFLLTDRANRYVGMMYGNADSIVLGWCQLKSTATAKGAVAAPKPAPKPVAAAPKPAASRIKTGDRVSVQPAGMTMTSEASVLQVRDGKVLVHYEDNNAPDEWVPVGTVTPFDAGNTAGGPPVGTYQCYHPMYENTYMGSFVIPSKGRYQYLTGSRKAGQYTYAPATRTLQWKSGELAGKVTKTEFVNTTRNGPIIELHFARGKRVGDYQRCLWRR